MVTLCLVEPSYFPLMNYSGQIIARALAFTQKEGASEEEIFPIAEAADRLDGEWPKIVFYENGYASDAIAGFNERGWPLLRRSGLAMAELLAKYKGYACPSEHE